MALQSGSTSSVKITGPDALTSTLNCYTTNVTFISKTDVHRDTQKSGCPRALTNDSRPLYVRLVKKVNFT